MSTMESMLELSRDPGQRGKAKKTGTGAKQTELQGEEKKQLGWGKQATSKCQTMA